MLHSLKELYALLTAKQRRRLFYLQFLVVLMSFAEVAGVAAMGPFMALVGDINQLQGQGLIAQYYRISGIENPTEFLYLVGLGVLITLALAALISIITIWMLSMYGMRIGAEVSSRLYRHYLYQDWLFHANGNSSQLTKQISQECHRVAVGVISPLMQMNAKLVLSGVMAAAIMFYNPTVALVGITIFSIAYFLLYITVRRKLVVSGKVMSEAQAHRFKLMGEGFGGIKDVLLLGRQSTFVERFDDSSRRFSAAMGTIQALSQVPRYVMELVAFASVILLVLYLLVNHDGNAANILPILSVYTLAGFKLLPAFQQVYTSISQIRASLAAFESIRDDLRSSALNQRSLCKALGSHESNNFAQWVPRQAILLRDITFHYPGKQEPALDRLTLEIPAKRVVGLVGASGSGKSTAIDLLLGLIEPEKGDILIDGKRLAEGDIRAWQNTIGFVPQSIFLADASIRENIAFGLESQAIDDVRVQRAARMAHLDDLVAGLPEGLETRVGERGIQLSGGERQRIGIARALYHDAEVLILDEATSALDGITEKLIMEAIHDFSGKKTIVMIAHRLATVKQCDCIYLMANGRVVDQGRYEELVDRNDIFKRMAAAA